MSAVDEGYVHVRWHTWCAIAAISLWSMGAQAAPCDDVRHDLAALRQCSDDQFKEGNDLDAFQAMSWRAELLLADRGATSIELDEAAYAAKKALQRAPKRPEAQLLLCEVAERRNATDELGACADALIALDPTQARAYRYKALVALAGGDFDDAEDHLDEARRLGLDSQEADAIQAQILAETPLYRDRRAWLFAWVLLVMLLVWRFRARILGTRSG